MFVKVFNQDNNAADWLFKVIRRVHGIVGWKTKCRRWTPKRAIEHEAYLTMLAIYQAKARVPEVLGIYKVGSNSYAMAARAPGCHRPRQNGPGGYYRRHA